MTIDLSKLTEAELVALNHRVVERIKVLRQSRYHETMANFSIGDRVSFTLECGHEIVGTVVRLNQKSITVVRSDGEQWRVSPTLLRRVADQAADSGNVGNLISLAEARLRGGSGA